MSNTLAKSAIVNHYREKSETGEDILYWRTGNKDIYNIADIKRQPLADNMFTIWIEEIERDMYFSPKEFPFGFDGDHLHIIDILEAESAEIALTFWKTRTKYDEIRLDPRNNKDYLVQIDQKYYHVISNHGEIPKRIEDSLLDEDYALNT